jgi:hypothetical protein
MAKYVIIKDSHGIESMYIFDGQHQHKWFSDKMNGTVVSAGFIVIRASHIICTGESLTLGIGSRPQDTDIAKKMFGLVFNFRTSALLL